MLEYLVSKVATIKRRPNSREQDRGHGCLENGHPEHLAIQERIQHFLYVADRGFAQNRHAAEVDDVEAGGFCTVLVEVGRQSDKLIMRVHLPALSKTHPGGLGGHSSLIRRVCLAY